MALATRRFAPQNALAERGAPDSEVNDLQRRFENLIQNVWSNAGIPDGVLWSPPVDIEETDDAWVVAAELPGVKREDVNVELRDNELAVTGEIKERERQGILRRTTRRVGEFELRVILPGETDPDAIDASLKDGVLTIRIPKATESKSRRIEVK
jgi:HSP20 family protein